MACLIDTEVAIRFRNRDPFILEKIEELAGPPFLSVISQVEMEGGVVVEPRLAAERRLSLDTLLTSVTVLPFDSIAAGIYRRIVENAGFSRRKISDRMIAATAIVHDLTLITMNGRDFRDISDLALEIWERPGL